MANNTSSTNEKIYHTMRRAGAGSIAIGVVTLVLGVSVGIIAIVNGAMLLKRKAGILF